MVSLFHRATINDYLLWAFPRLATHPVCTSVCSVPASNSITESRSYQIFIKMFAAARVTTPKGQNSRLSGNMPHGDSDVIYSYHIYARHNLGQGLQKCLILRHHFHSN